MSHSLPSFGLSQGTLRSAFDGAARGFEAVRQNGDASPAVSAAPSVEAAIANAARQTGVDFAFLLAQARVESGLDPAARAHTSSATGLYQFIESTWLGTMKRHGARFGLGGMARAIEVDRDGTAHVANPRLRADILAMRHDPQVAAWMAAGLAEDNAAHLTPILGRHPDHGELYLAHFLGAGGAGRFLAAMQDDPHQSAAALFGKAAAVNAPIFYAADGTARSLGSVMSHLAAKMEHATGINASGGNPPASWQAVAPARAELVAAPYLSDLLSARAMSRPLSDVLSVAFGMQGAASEPPARAQAQVRRAYSQLRAFDL